MQAFVGQPSEWNALIASLPNPHLLQTWEWSQVKAKYGWEPFPFVWEPETGGRESVIAAAMILKRTISIGGFTARLSVLYAPKGPLMDWGNGALRRRVLDDLQQFAKRQDAIFLKIDPDVLVGMGVPQGEDEVIDNGGQAVRSALERRGWVFSSDQVQFRNTVLIDLSPSEDEILAHMKQKTRYNLRLAMKKDVVIRPGTQTDWPLLYQMYAETSVRDGFVIRDEGYYRTVWGTFMPSNVETLERSDIPICEPLIAEVEGIPIAGLFLFMFAGRAYYLYGMSLQAHREKMPNYLLQWEAMKRAKVAGCHVYDLWGAPDEFDEHDSMWGVYRFKEGLGGQVVRRLGAWDFSARPSWYKLYTQVLPRLLSLMRFRGKARTRREIAA
jgi:peptidoglycan pentaglycine glycine transferase (the first glycine)